jgi:hypothetical protein
MKIVRRLLIGVVGVSKLNVYHDVDFCLLSKGRKIKGRNIDRLELNF